MVLVSKFLRELTNKSVLRVALLDKLLLTNTYACPTVFRGRLFFELKNLNSFDSSRILAASFALRLLGGSKPYFVRFGLFQTFHNKDYDALAVVDLNAKFAHQLIEIISVNILPFVAKADFSTYALKNKEGVEVNFTVADLSFIRVIETHSIFFK